MNFLCGLCDLCGSRQAKILFRRGAENPRPIWIALLAQGRLTICLTVQKIDRVPQSDLLLLPSRDLRRQSSFAIFANAISDLHAIAFV
jgi:hypothetical protein